MTPEFIKAEPMLVPRICNSIALLDLDIHPERVPAEFASSSADTLRKHHAGRRQLARLLRRRFDLQRDEFPSHVELNQQLSLVGWEALCRGLDLTAKVLLWPRVVRSIVRESHQEAQRVFGAADYAFVTKTGPLLIRENQVSALKSALHGEHGSMEQSYAQVHRFALGQLWSGESRSFRTRVELKFPPDIEITDDMESERAIRQQLARLMRRILVQHVDPEVQECFA